MWVGLICLCDVILVPPSLELSQRYDAYISDTNLALYWDISVLPRRLSVPVKIAERWSVNLRGGQIRPLLASVGRTLEYAGFLLFWSRIWNCNVAW